LGGLRRGRATGGGELVLLLVAYRVE